jgi:serine protease Do
VGLRLAEPAAATEARTPAAGLAVRGVQPGGPADRAGLEIGMAITHAGGRAVRSLAEFRAALAARDPARNLVLRIRRGDQAGFRVILAETIPGERPRR